MHVDSDSATATAGLIAAAGGHALGLGADLSTDDGNRSMIEAMVAQFGDPDLQVYGAIKGGLLARIY